MNIYSSFNIGPQRIAHKPWNSGWSVLQGNSCSCTKGERFFSILVRFLLLEPNIQDKIIYKESRFIWFKVLETASTCSPSGEGVPAASEHSQGYHTVRWTSCQAKCHFLFVEGCWNCHGGHSDNFISPKSPAKLCLQIHERMIWESGFNKGAFGWWVQTTPTSKIQQEESVYKRMS